MSWSMVDRVSDLAYAGFISLLCLALAGGLVGWLTLAWLGSVTPALSDCAEVQGRVESVELRRRSGHGPYLRLSIRRDDGDGPSALFQVHIETDAAPTLQAALAQPGQPVSVWLARSGLASALASVQVGKPADAVQLTLSGRVLHSHADTTAYRKAQRLEYSWLTGFASLFVLPALYMAWRVWRDMPNRP